MVDLAIASESWADGSLRRIVMWCGLALAPLPLLVQYGASLWKIDEYQYFPVLLVCLGALIYLRWDRVVRPITVGSRLLAVCSLLTILAAIVLGSPWLACVGAVLGFGGWLWTHHRFATSPLLAPHLLELWPLSFLLIRLPLNLDQRLTIWLQHVSAGFSSLVLDFLGITHRLQGVTIELASGSLFIEEACSGVQSLFTLLFCAFLIVAWFQRSMALLPLYALAAAASAGIMNGVRISAVAWAQEVKGIDLAHGVPHAILGYICLALAILLLLSFDRLLQIVFYPVPANADDGAKANPLRDIWNRLFGRQAIGSKEIEDGVVIERPRLSFATTGLFRGRTSAVVGGLCLLLWIPQFLFIANELTRDRTPTALAPVGRDGLIWEPSEASLAGASGVVQTSYEKVREGDDIQLGRNADIWTVSFEGVPAVSRVVLSQTYDEFHDLCICYTGTGWSPTEKSEVKFKDANDRETRLVKTLFVRKDGRYGYLTFSGVHADGSTADLPAQPSLGSVLAERFSLTSAGSAPAKRETAMIQTWTVSETPLAPADANRLYQSHETIHRAIQESLRGK
jgi:exosortase